MIPTNIQKIEITEAELLRLAAQGQSLPLDAYKVTEKAMPRKPWRQR